MIKTFLMGVGAVASLIFPLNAFSYTIYPVPQNQVIKSEMITLTPTVNVVLSASTNESTANRVKEVLTNANIDFVVSAARSEAMTDIVVGVNGSDDQACGLAKDYSLDMSVFPAGDGKYDPYLLSVVNDGSDGLILIVGDDCGSAFYGLATLEQMLDQRSGNQLQTVNFEDYASVKMRGIVEGFDGFPYPAETRLNLLDFCKRYKLNTYVYGPKGDPYHAGSWRSSYPETVTDQQKSNGVLTRIDIEQLAKKAKDCGVDLVYSVHPALQGGGINFYNLDPGVADIMTKFSDMYSLGVRHFAVSVDDMSGHPSTQGQLAQAVQTKLNEAYNTDGASEEDRVGGLLFVPTGYALNYSGATSVLRQFAGVSGEINVAFTGYDCFSNIREASFNEAAEYINRKPIFWWNNPVNDDYDDFLYMHGLTQRWKIEDDGAIRNMGGLLLNPMNQAGPSKIAIFNGADYSWNPAGFDADKSWEASLMAVMDGEEYGNALATFVDMLSAYSTTETGGSDSSKPNGFNSCKKQAPEGEKYGELFSAFRNSFSADNVPDNTELRSVLSNALYACEKLHDLEHSANPDHYLFYRDFRPWFLKVEQMCRLSYEALSLMSGSAEDIALDNWTDVSNISDRIRTYHNNDDFKVKILEGTTSQRVVSIEALPAPRDFEPFVDWLADVVGDQMVELPERCRDMQLISNLDDFSALKLTETEGVYHVSCSDAVNLAWSEYVGVYLNRIYDIDVAEIDVPESLVLQYSINGKTWFLCDPSDEEPITAAYLRVINRGDYQTIMPSNLLTFSCVSGSGNVTPASTISSNMGTYSSYALENAIDGNLSSFYWSNGAPAAGKSYICVDLGGEFSIQDVNLHFCENDQPSGEVALQVSSDGSTWTTLTTFTSADIKNELFSYQLSGTNARYVRMFYLTVPTVAWVKLAEFQVNCNVESVSSHEVAIDNGGNSTPALDDRSLTTCYTPHAAGYIDYTVIENINVESVEIYHDSKFDYSAQLPQVKIFADGDWHNMGSVDKCRTIIDTRDLKNISTVRVEWNDTNRPVLYQIMPVGTPYIELPDIIASIDEVKSNAYPVEVKCLDGNTIQIKAEDEIQSVVVTDLSGRVIASVQPCANETTLRVAQSPIVVVSVALKNVTYNTKLLIK